MYKGETIPSNIRLVKYFRRHKSVKKQRPETFQKEINVLARATTGKVFQPERFSKIIIELFEMRRGFFRTS